MWVRAQRGTFTITVSAIILSQFYARPSGLSNIAILCNRPNNFCQQNLKCFNEPLFSLGLFS